MRAMKPLSSLDRGDKMEGTLVVLLYMRYLKCRTASVLHKTEAACPSSFSRFYKFSFFLKKQVQQKIVFDIFRWILYNSYRLV